MRKYQIVLRALEEGHEFTDAEGSKLYSARAEDGGPMKVLFQRGENHFNLTINAFIDLCEGFPEDYLDELEASLEGLTPR